MGIGARLALIRQRRRINDLPTLTNEGLTEFGEVFACSDLSRRIHVAPPDYEVMRRVLRFRPFHVLKGSKPSRRVCCKLASSIRRLFEQRAKDIIKIQEDAGNVLWQNHLLT